RDRVRLELRRTVLHDHEMSVLRSSGSSVSCVQDQGSRPTFRTPYYHHREQPAHYQEFNRNHARLRAPRERAFAQLKSWRLLRRARCSTRRIGTIVQAVHTLLTCDYRG
ncbi:transposase family protein, partial [Streptomyces globisporus]